MLYTLGVSVNVLLFSLQHFFFDALLTLMPKQQEKPSFCFELTPVLSAHFLIVREVCSIILGLSWLLKLVTLLLEVQFASTELP